jgi:hypothetical protein
MINKKVLKSRLGSTHCIASPFKMERYFIQKRSVVSPIPKGKINLPYQKSGSQCFFFVSLERPSFFLHKHVDNKAVGFNKNQAK